MAVGEGYGNLLVRKVFSEEITLKLRPDWQERRVM